MHRPFLFGSATWTRTRDPMINSHLLYRLSYRGSDAAHFTKKIRKVKALSDFCQSVRSFSCFLQHGGHSVGHVFDITLVECGNADPPAANCIDAKLTGQAFNLDFGQA